MRTLLLDLLAVLSSLSTSFIKPRRPRREIDQAGIYQLKNLVILHANNNNNKIFDVNHLSETLEQLYIILTCGVSQAGISELKHLTVLHASCNTKITDVNHLQGTLKELWIDGDCGVGQADLYLW